MFMTTFLEAYLEFIFTNIIISLTLAECLSIGLHVLTAVSVTSQFCGREMKRYQPAPKSARLNFYHPVLTDLKVLKLSEIKFDDARPFGTIQRQLLQGILFMPS